MNKSLIITNDIKESLNLLRDYNPETDEIRQEIKKAILKRLHLYSSNKVGIAYASTKITNYFLAKYIRSEYKKEDRLEGFIKDRCEEELQVIDQILLGWPPSSLSSYSFLSRSLLTTDYSPGFMRRFRRKVIRNICENSQWAYEFAYYVDQWPSDDTRKAACKDSRYAYVYAVGVDKKYREDTHLAACKSISWCKRYQADFNIE